MKLVRTILRILPVLLALVVSDVIVVSAGAEVLDGYTLVAENDHLQLLLNEDTTEIAVVRKVSGQVWYSNPPNRKTRDRIANTTRMTHMNSQFTIGYFTPSDDLLYMDNFTESLAYGQWEVTEIENGIRIDYTLGKKWDENLYVPLMIRKDRFEEMVLSNVESEKDRNLLLKRYSLISLEKMEEGDTRPKVSNFDTESVFGDYKLVILDPTGDENFAPDEDDIEDATMLLCLWLTVTRGDIPDRRHITSGDVSQLIENPTYIVSDKLGWDRPDIIRILRESGYTPEDYQVDAGDNHLGVPQPNVITFDVPVAYYLDGEEFVAEIITEEIRYPIGIYDRFGKPGNYPLHEIRFLEYFGAAHMDEEGYIFIPDGSGALIYLDNGKTDLDDYKDTVYGRDNSVGNVVSKPYYTREQVHLPVFGMKTGDQAFLAVIEKGDTFSSIQAAISRKYSAYNTVNASFTIVPKGVVQIATGFAWRSDANNYRTVINSYQSVQNTEPARIRYMFLDGEDATYSGMARRYQAYLVDQHNLTRIESREGVAFILELIGGIHVHKPVLGLPLDVIVPLTTYAQVQTVVDEIRSNSGIDEIVLRYSGWLEGGLHHSFPNRVRLERALGSGQDFSNLVDYVAENGIDFYPNVSFMYVYRDSLFDGFTQRKHAAQTLGKEAAVIYDYDLINNRFMPNSAKYVLSPFWLTDIMAAFGRNLDSYGIDGVSLEFVGNSLYSDFREDVETTVERFRAKENVIAGLRELKDTIGSVMVRGGNAYVLPFADVIIDAPSSSEFNLTDRAVPFFQMVAHGFIDYAGDPLNFSHDLVHEVLRMIETGAYPYFTLMYEDNSVLKNTDFDYLLSTNYRRWLPEISEIYAAVNHVLGPVQNQRIVSHEEIVDGVYKTTYENGYSTIVNYREDPVSIGDTVVDGRGFKVIEEVTAGEN